MPKVRGKPAPRLFLMCVEDLSAISGERFIGPVANAILVVLAAGYVWRLLTHKVELDSGESEAKPD